MNNNDRLKSPVCFLLIFFIAFASNLVGQVDRGHASEPDFELTTRQITFGPKHHFFGYIGHTKIVPWNKSDRYLLALEVDFQDHLPKPRESANILLLDANDNYKPKQIERTLAWNFQIGSMMCWNPLAAETQFFFNDRDPKTNEIFCVLFDISKGKNGERVAEYRFKDTPIGSAAVAHSGKWFVGVNYGKLARTRVVTGYPKAYDWTLNQTGQPTNDGIFKVNVATKEKQLLVSFKQLADVLERKYPNVQGQNLFINYALLSPDDRKLLFFARADFDTKDKRVNGLFVMNTDGTDLRMIEPSLGGHPEWMSNHELVGGSGKRHFVFDVNTLKLTGHFGSPEIFPDPTGDVAFSPDEKWFVSGFNGGSDKNDNVYSALRLGDGAWKHSAGLNKEGFRGGDRRIDPAPAWNRASNQFIAYGLCPKDSTRQMFLISIKKGQSE